MSSPAALSTSPDLLQGSVSRALLRLSMPLIGAMFLETAFNLVNTLWVGRVGTLSLAAVNLASFPVWLLFALSGVVTTGTNAVVAQELGAAAGCPERRQGAVRAGALGIRLALLFGVIQALLMAWLGRDLLEAMVGTAPGMEAVVEHAHAYLILLFMFAPVHCANEAISAVLRACGDTRTPTLVYAAGFILNLTLDPLLIFGWGPFPRLGILGAALATNLSFLVVLVGFTALLASGRLVYSLPTASSALPTAGPGGSDRGLLARMVRIGLPSSLSSVVFCVVYMSLVPVVGGFGEEALAALGIGHRVEGISYLVCYALALATVTLVGQSVGAGRLARAERVAWTAAAVTAAFTGLVSCLFLLFPRPLAGLFTSDPAVVEMTVPYLRIIAFSQVFMGVAMVLDGAFAGAGQTLTPTLVSIPLALLRAPGARLAAWTWDLGIQGVWWCITLLTVVRGTLTCLLFFRGGWKNGLVGGDSGRPAEGGRGTGSEARRSGEP